jgi:hypothetical protein
LLDEALMNRRFAAPVCCAFLLAFGCYPAVDGNGEPAVETRTIEGFNGVDCESSFDVRVEQGDAFAVAVNIDSNLVPFVRTWVSGGTLHVDSNQRISTHLPGPHVTIRMPQVSNAALSGSGRLAVLGVEGAHPLSLRLSGSGNVDFDGSAPAIDVNLSGSGDVNLAGNASRVKLELSGSGSIDAANLPAAGGSVDLGGSGNIRATINGPADAWLRGSGDIDLYGDVDLQRSSKSGSGNIRVH